MFCRSLFVLLYFFFWPLCCPVLLRYTDSDCPFGIFKLFCNIAIHFYVRLTNIDESKDVAKQYVHFNIRTFIYLPVTRRIYRKQLYARCQILTNQKRNKAIHFNTKLLNIDRSHDVIKQYALLRQVIKY